MEIKVELIRNIIICYDLTTNGCWEFANRAAQMMLLGKLSIFIPLEHMSWVCRISIKMGTNGNISTIDVGVKWVTFSLSRLFANHFLLPFVVSAMTFNHVLFIHRTGINNPLVRKINNDKIPFHSRTSRPRAFLVS